MLVDALGGEIRLDLRVDLLSAVVTPDSLDMGRSWHIAIVILQAVADVDQGSSNFVLMLDALDRRELGIVIEHSENIPLAIIACSGIGASNIRVKELQDSGSFGIGAGGGRGSLCICHDAGFTESVWALLCVLDL
jgi:hypothetical protein